MVSFLIILGLISLFVFGLCIFLMAYLSVIAETLEDIKRKDILFAIMEISGTILCTILLLAYCYIAYAITCSAIQNLFLDNQAPLISF